MLLVLTNKGTPGLRANFFCPYHDSYPGIELQVPPTPQLVKRGEDLTFTGPMEAGMIGDFLWFQGNLCPVFVVYKS